jgi:arylsulfatase A-like enzyme
MFLLILGACGNDPVLEPEITDNLLVILIDTLRADALAAADTPNLDALAERGAKASHAWSAGTWTVPSIHSLFTGMSVREHGWDEPSARMGHYPLLAELQNLPTVLQKTGFHTAAFYSNPYLAEGLGMERGFEIWQRTSDQQMAQVLKKHLQAHSEDDQRHFTYLHLLGPHSPLRPSEAARTRWDVDARWFDAKRGLGIGAAKRNKKEGVREAYRKGYHAVIEDTDVLVGEILQSLGPAKESTWVLVTSDHGEMLGEQDLVGHGRHLFQGLTHVPFLLAPPVGRQHMDLPEAFSNAVLPDVACTILGVKAQWPNRLENPFPLIAQREGMLALSPDGQSKAIWDKTERQYDLRADPTEEKPLPLSEDLSRARAAWEAATPKGAPSDKKAIVDAAATEELRALGYQD